MVVVGAMIWGGAIEDIKPNQLQREREREGRMSGRKERREEDEEEKGREGRKEKGSEAGEATRVLWLDKWHCQSGVW